MTAVAGALGVVAVLTLGRMAAHGGFYSDDWADAAGRFYTPGGATFGHVLSYFRGVFGYRPILVVYMPLKYTILGTNSGWHIAWSGALGVAGATTLYVLLRKLGVARQHAIVIAALTIVYPWSDSLRLWGSPSHELLSTALTLGGILAALHAIERRSRHLHALSAVLFLAALLIFELTLPLIAAAGTLYVAVAGWQRARVRWAFDIGLATAGAVWVRTRTPHGVLGPDAAWTHARRIVSGGTTIALRTLDPSGVRPHTAIVFVVAGTAVAAALALEWRGQRGGRPWLAMIFAGLAVAVLGWLALVPADPYYTPGIFGLDNRVNGVAGIGLILSAYGALGLITWLAGVAVAPARHAMPALTVALGLVLGAGYVHVLERHIDIWQAAKRSQGTLVHRLHAAYPRLPTDATVFTTGFPGYETFGVPIFGTTWDLNGRVKFLYDDATMSGYPIIGEQRLDCRAGGVAVIGQGATPGTARYGMAYLLNVHTGARAVPSNRVDCERVVRAFPAGPIARHTEY